MPKFREWHRVRGHLQGRPLIGILARPRVYPHWKVNRPAFGLLLDFECFYEKVIKVKADVAAVLD